MVGRPGCSRPAAVRGRGEVAGRGSPGPRGRPSHVYRTSATLRASRWARHPRRPRWPVPGRGQHPESRRALRGRADHPARSSTPSCCSRPCGTVRYPHHDDQTTQAHCHTLVVNACILSTTGYLQDAIDACHAEGHQISDAAIAHLSPAHFEAINPLRHPHFRRRRRHETPTATPPSRLTAVSRSIARRFGAANQETPSCGTAAPPGASEQRLVNPRRGVRGCRR